MFVGAYGLSLLHWGEGERKEEDSPWTEVGIEADLARILPSKGFVIQPATHEQKLLYRRQETPWAWELSM